MKRKLSNNIPLLAVLVSVTIASTLYLLAVSASKYIWMLSALVATGLSIRLIKVVRKAILEFLNGPARFCRGKGIEIGSCGRHLVKGSMLVDCITDYSHTIPYHVDYIADAHSLPQIPSGSMDYVCASHVLEHLTNPIRAILEWLRILKPGGILWLKIPDKEKTFDRPRKRTTLAHLIEDFKNNPKADDPAHIDDHNMNTDPPRDQRHPYVHNHVWIPDDILELFGYINEKLSALKIVKWEKNSCKNTQDFWIVIEKPGETRERQYA